MISLTTCSDFIAVTLSDDAVATPALVYVE